MAATQTSQGIPLIGPILNRIIGTRNERFVKKYFQRVTAINAQESKIRSMSDADLRGKVHEFRERLDKGTSALDLLVDAFSVAREAMDRGVGIRNIFNPLHEGRFDASRLPERARALYEDVKVRAAAMPTLIPRTIDFRKHTQAPEGVTAEDVNNAFLGCTDPVPGWMQVEIPQELYEAVRAMYPESRPPFRARPFDVQLIGGMVLYQGKISEMKTGEGKTIVAPLACYLAAIERLKVHVVTVNDYLVQRDRDWTFPYFQALGLTVGAIHPMHLQDEDQKRRMYQCDVVYGTTAEFGFDYLRDNMKRSVEQQVQRVREMAIVDEVDSILIDEARTPLIISGLAHEGAPRYDLADRLARHLVDKQKPWQQADDRVQECMRKIKGFEGDIRNAREKDKIPALAEEMKKEKGRLPGLEADRARHTQFYETELDRKQVHATHQGIAEAQRAANIGSFYVGENMDLPHLLEQSLRAHVVYQRDRDYIVRPMENQRTGRMEESVVIVDVFTGRAMVGRQWSDGLHQAVEAKEQVPIKEETQTVATITIQNFFKMYKRLSGMTGTADTEAQEFHDIYHLDVVSIPTNLPVVRRDFDDMIFLAPKDKWNAIVDEVKTFHDVGRPVLVGTTSVENSEMLGKMLSGKHQVKHEVLNAKQHEREAHIVENAGQLGQVMIATNMAGRGTDIKLGQVTREQLLNHWLIRGLCSRTLTIDATDEQLRENVYRKIAPQELEIPKREAEEIPFDKLELQLLRSWAMKHTWISPKKIDSATADQLRQWLDDHGRCVMHRVRWYGSIEDMGGLHVIGTERHESRRIDNQLRGRSGRQGDKGSSRFYASLQDPLMARVAGETMLKVLSRLGLKEGDAMEHPMLSKSVERAQRKVEEHNFQARKNIVEYDEVMEHQRRGFYGLRQRVLEGRNMRGLIFDYITDSATDAVENFLGKNYASECAAEFARQVIDFPIQPERLRGLDIDEMIKRVRADAKDEARSAVTVTIGEYMPEAEGEEGAAVDFDTAGLASWAKTSLDVVLDPVKLREDGLKARRQVIATLVEAAERKVDGADLSGLTKYTDPEIGAKDLSNWVRNKFEFDLPAAEITRSLREGQGPSNVVNRVVEKAQQLYRKREIEDPVEFMMAIGMQRMRENPQQAAEMIVNWANQRFNLGWTLESLRATPPQQARQQLLDAQKKFVEDGTLQKHLDEALEIHDREKLAAHFKERYGVTLPDNVLRMTGTEREEAIAARVESVLRAELLFFERTMLLDTLDPSWKDHLYAMDQLRDTINYRAFSQQDPRIEYKREGSQLFQQMMEGVKERVTDMVFKLKLTPQAGPPGPRPMARPIQPPMVTGAPRAGGDGGGLYVPPSQAGRPAAGAGAGMISGPGLDTMGGARAPTAPRPAAPGNRPTPEPGRGNGAPSVPIAAPSAAPSERAQRELDAANRAGSDPTAKAQTVVKGDKRYGRNDPCPMGCGRKYKKCCNKSDGTCDGSGMNSAAPADGDAD